MEMTEEIAFVLFSLLGYLIGSFPTGVVLSKQKYGIDVREMGSGNIGATNMTRVFGWYAGLAVFSIDFLKGYLPLFWLTHRFPQSPWLGTSVGIALVLGHCFSPYLKFRGGKGVATSLGCLSVVSPLAAFFAAAAYFILLMVTRISAVGSLGGLGVTLIYLAVARPTPPVVLLVVGVSLIVVIKHHTNIRRLLGGLKTGGSG